MFLQYAYLSLLILIVPLFLYYKSYIIFIQVHLITITIIHSSFTNLIQHTAIGKGRKQASMLDDEINDANDHGKLVPGQILHDSGAPQVPMYPHGASHIPRANTNRINKERATYVQNMIPYLQTTEKILVVATTKI